MGPKDSFWGSGLGVEVGALKKPMKSFETSSVNVFVINMFNNVHFEVFARNEANDRILNLFFLSAKKKSPYFICEYNP